MTVYELKNTTVLAGESSNLAPVVFLTGGAHASSGPYTALELPLELAPAEQRTLQWVSAALDTKSNSFHLVRSLLDRPWAPELARLEILNAGQIGIVTGDQGWDTAFALAQNAAYRLLVSGNDHLPHTSFVMARQPDYGYSHRGNGSDYNHLWNGQTALYAFYLAAYFLPTDPEVARGLLENFLNAQNEDGSIDAKPGLGGQRSRVNAAPLLASMAWRIYKAKPERSFLESVCRCSL